jgi:hypothetical protein
MPDLSLMVVDNGGGRARFIVERTGVWQDGDVGLRPEWEEVARQLFSEFTEYLENKRPLSQMWVRAKCREIFKHVVPDATKTILSKALDSTGTASTQTLTIYTDPVFDHVPWELLHDGTGYLGLRVRMARMPIVADPPVAPPDVRRVEIIYNLLGRGVVDPPQEQDLFKEWLETFGAVPNNAYPPAGGNPVWPTLELVEEACSADILHLTCHGLSNGVGWTLDKSAGDPSVISGTVVEDLTLKNGSPLVFANACASVAGAGMKPGLAPKFIKRGTLNLIGTFAPVTRDVALPFARRFYGYLLGTGGQQAVSIAEALLLTKQQFHHTAMQAATDAVYDPSYLFYCLYGTADSRFQLTQRTPVGNTV